MVVNVRKPKTSDMDLLQILEKTISSGKQKNESKKRSRPKSKLRLSKGK